MAKQLEPAASVFLKDETVYTILMAQKPGRNGPIRATEIFNRWPAGVAPQQLGADIRKALDAFHVFQTAKEFDVYPDLAARMAGGADKLEEFEKDLGAVTIETSNSARGFAIAALTSDNEVMDGTLEFLERDCSDTKLGSTVWRAAKLCARKRSGENVEEDGFENGRFATVYEKNGAIHVVSMYCLSSDGDYRTHRLIATFPSDVAEAALGAKIRTALKAYAVLDRAAKGFGPEAEIGPGKPSKKKRDAFCRNVGRVWIIHWQDQEQINVGPWRGVSYLPKLETHFDVTCSDAELGGAALDAMNISLGRKPSARTLVTAKKAPAKKTVKTFKRPAGDKGLAADLDKLGFFKCSDDLGAAYACVKKDSWVGAMLCESGRCFFADAEELAEGGAGETLGEMAAFFSAMGVEAPEIETDSEDEGYVLVIDGKPHPILKPADLKKEASKPGYSWGIATFRTAEAVNALLTNRGLSERCYAIEGGNQGYFLLITPEMHKAITSAKGYEPKRGPYVMTDKYSSFGQPRSR